MKSAKLFPKKFFTVLDFVALEEFMKLLIKRASAMMFALIADVINHRLTLGSANGKRAIARLPREAALGFGVGPFGGVSLDAAHHVGNGNCVGHPREDVDVVGHAVDDQSVASFAVDHSG